jgi:hypothetical protein
MLSGMRHVLPGLGLSVVVVALSACGSDSPVGPNPNFLAGSWLVAAQFFQSGGVGCYFPSTTVSLAQDGSDVTGTFPTWTGSCTDQLGAFDGVEPGGTITGTVSTGRVADTVVQLNFTAPSPNNSFVMNGSYHADSIIGFAELMVQDPSGNYVAPTGAWIAVRAPVTF